MTHIQQLSAEEASDIFAKIMCGCDENIIGDTLTTEGIDLALHVLNLELEQTDRLITEINVKIKNLPIGDIINQSNDYRKLHNDYVSHKEKHDIVQHILKKFEEVKKTEEAKKAEHGLSLTMNEEQRHLAESILKRIESLMNDHYPNVKAVVSTNIDISVLTLTERPSSADLIVEIGNFINAHIKSYFVDIVDTHVIVTVGREINQGNNKVHEKCDKKCDVGEKRDDTRDIWDIVGKRLDALVQTGQIPQNKDKYIVPVNRVTLEHLLETLKKTDFIAILSDMSEQYNIGDIVVLCTDDGKNFISSPFAVEGQSDSVFEGNNVTFLQKLNVHKVW